MASKIRYKGMGSVYKRGGIYYASWNVSPTERVSRSCRTSDRARAEQLLNKWQAEANARRMGLIDTAAEERAEKAARPITEHAEDYLAFIEGKKRDGKHVENLRRGIMRLIEHGSMPTLADVSPSRVVAGLRMMMESDTITPGGISRQTANHYLRAFKSFTRWAVGDRRATVDPIATVEGWNVEDDRRRERRALSDDEAACLLAAADASPTVSVQRWARIEGKSVQTTGTATVPERGMLYRLALATGLRAGELAALTPESFHIAGDEPFIRVAAADSKRRRAEDQPIAASVAALLRPWLASKPRAVPVFRFDIAKAAAWLRSDIDTARAAWLDEAGTPAERAERAERDFLRHTDAAGRVVDLHALRHTYVTNVVRMSTNAGQAMMLARHSDPKLTLKRYNTLRPADVRPMLPELPTARGAASEPAMMKATGTDDAAPADAAAEVQRNSQQMSRESEQAGAMAPIGGMSGDSVSSTRNTSTTAPLRFPVQHDATGPKGRLPDLNRGPAVYKTAALPAELSRRG